jgi:Sulfotransferase family
MEHIEGNFFVCIGAQKAGTRWLHDNLGRHPGVWVPYVKELHYFDGLHISGHRRFLERISASAMRRAQRPHARLDAAERAWCEKFGSPAAIDDAWYISLFASATSLDAFGEITPEYAMLPEVGFAHLARLAPQARIIFIMRNPVERAWSQIRFKAGKRDNQSILSPDRALRFIDSPASEDRTAYDRTIQRLERCYPVEQLLYLFYEDIVRDGLEVLRKVSEHIGVKYNATYFPDASQPRNVSMPVEMPPQVREHLQEKYAYLANAVALKVGRVPSEWRWA